MIGRIPRGGFHFVENLRGNLPYGTRRNNNPLDFRMVIETVRYLGIEMTVLLKIQIGNEGVPEINRTGRNWYQTIVSRPR